MSKLLQVKNLSKAYNKIQALNKISFEMSKGEITGLVGLNGAGKTSCIKSILGLIKPSEGEIYLHERIIRSRKELATKVAYISDNPIYFEDLTVIEHLKFTAMLYNIDKNQMQKREKRAIELLNLHDHINKFPDKLSKGTKQKLIIACNMMRDFDILIADEPFTALDPESIRALKEIFIEFSSEGKGILLSTHLLDCAERICQKYIILHKGQTLATGTKAEIISEYNLQSSLSLEDIFLKFTSKEKRYNE